MELNAAFLATGGTVQDLTQDKIKAFGKALGDLTNVGAGPGSGLFTQLQEELVIFQSSLAKTPVTIKIPVVITPLESSTNRAAIEGIAKGLNADFSRAFISANDKALAEIIERGTEEGIAGISSAIGRAFTGGGLSGVFDAFINGIASLGESLGKQLITTGVAIEAFKTSLSSLQGFGAIAAGAALIAASAAFRSLAKGGVGSFATGGTAFGPQLALIGDNPGREEHIIPSEVMDRLGGGTGVLQTRFSVDEFIIWLDRGRRAMNG